MSIPFHEDQIPPINPGECHVACTVVVDTSVGMSGAPIEALNRGLAEFGNALAQNFPIQGRADVTIISFNSSVKTELGFRPATEYEAPTLAAGGLSAMNEAINTALDALEARKTQYRETGILYHRPLLFLLSGSTPTDSHLESSTRARLQKAIKENKVFYLPIGIGENADSAKLQSYYPEDVAYRVVLNSDTCDFNEVFSFSPMPISFIEPKTEISIPQLPDWFRIEL